MERFTSPDTVITHWREHCEAKGEMFSEQGFIYKLNVLGEKRRSFVFDFTSKPTIYEGDAVVDAEVSLSGDDLVLIAKRELNPQEAYLGKRLRVHGLLTAIVMFNIFFQSVLGET